MPVDLERVHFDAQMVLGRGAYPFDVTLQRLRDGKGMLRVFSCNHGQVLDVIAVVHLKILKRLPKVFREVLGFLVGSHGGCCTGTSAACFEKGVRKRREVENNVVVVGEIDGAEARLGCRGLL